MSVDVLILNTAVTDFRGDHFTFVENLVGLGGLSKYKTSDTPDYSQSQYNEWIQQGCAMVGGPGNTAPLLARAGLTVAVGVNLGKGKFDGLDAQGRYFYNMMVREDIDMSETYVHPELPTGTAFIYEQGNSERPGIAYFPNANDDFDFERFSESVIRLRPKIVYYMYSGLSERGDSNGGRDLAEFIRWSRSYGCVAIVDSHTLTANPHELIDSGAKVSEYDLLRPLLPELDLFFTSSDEAKMIKNTLGEPRQWKDFDQNENCRHFLDFLTQQFWRNENRCRLFGVTVSNGAYEKHISKSGTAYGPEKVESRFLAGNVVDLVGAGDSFRAGVISYIAKNIEDFQNGEVNFAEAIQMGNLFAALYIKAPLGNRYGNIAPFEKMLKAVQSKVIYGDFDELLEAIN